MEDEILRFRALGSKNIHYHKRGYVPMVQGDAVGLGLRSPVFVGGFTHRV